MKALNVLCIFFVSASIPLFAQQSSISTAPSAPNTPSQSAAQASSSKNRQITLDVVVANKSGKPQSGLQQEDFTLLDNKVQQKILSFSAVNDLAKADPPVEVILLIDTVNTSVDAISDARGQIEKYLRRNDGKLAHPTSIVVFSNSGLKVEDPPSLDGNALSASLKANKEIGLRTPRPGPGTSVESDHFVSSLAALNSLVTAQAGVPGRKMVIWFSQGWPLLVGAEKKLDPKLKESLFASVIAVSEMLQRTHITLYNIDPEGSTLGSATRSDKFAYLTYLKGVSTANDVSPANLSLQVLATQSGGRVLINGIDVASQIQSCVDDSNAFYVLSLEAAPGPQGQYHSLELKVDKPGLTASTTTGYYTQP